MVLCPSFSATPAWPWPLSSCSDLPPPPSTSWTVWLAHEKHPAINGEMMQSNCTLKVNSHAGKIPSPKNCQKINKDTSIALSQMSRYHVRDIEIETDEHFTNAQVMEMLLIKRELNKMWTCWWTPFTEKCSSSTALDLTKNSQKKNQDEAVAWIHCTYIITHAGGGG